MRSLLALLIVFESTAAVNWWLPRDQGEAWSVCGGVSREGNGDLARSGSWGGGLRQGLKVGHQYRGAFGEVRKPNWALKQSAQPQVLLADHGVAGLGPGRQDKTSSEEQDDLVKVGMSELC